MENYLSQNLLGIKKQRLKSRIIFKIILLVFAFLIYTIFNALKQNRDISEWITMHISSFLVKMTGSIFKVLPVSAFELIIICLICYAVLIIIDFIKLLKHKKFLSIISGGVSIVLAIIISINCYNLFAGFSYYRSSLSVPLSTKEYTQQEVYNLNEYFLNDFNNLSNKLERDKDGNVISPYKNLKELSQAINKEFNRHNFDYLFKYDAVIKPIVNSWFMKATSITGIAFLPTGESNVNASVFPTSLPHIIGHELAHTKGIMRENEANLIAEFVLLSAKDDYLRYCGYFTSFSSILSSVDVASSFDSDVYFSYSTRLDDKIRQVYKNSKEYWSNYNIQNLPILKHVDSILAKAGEFFNSLYLKFNGAKDGTGSYNNDEYDYTDTGKIDENNKPIYNYSNIHKMYFYIYENI